MKAITCSGMGALASIALFSVTVSADTWKFGLISDTQWPVGSDDGKNPNAVAVDIINQVNQEFIRQGVKLVITTGDIEDNTTTLGVDTRVTYIQALYNAGIAFYPVRGNHDDAAAVATEFKRVFPQTQNGINNNTPTNAFIYTDSIRTHPAPKLGTTFTVGTNFSSPSTNLAGLSYSFRYQNATFLFLDQFTTPSGTAYTITSQQPWISSTLAGRPAGTHAFVFGHKGLIMENHIDGICGNLAQDTAQSNTLIRSLVQNGVRCYIGGHDHIYNRAMVTTSDGAVRLQEIILGSDSYKFYTPVIPPNDSVYDVPKFGRACETQIRQELNHIVYYIVTVDSSRVIVDYYTVPVTPNASGDITTTPPLTDNWKKHETFGYSLNGRDFMITQGQSYSSVVDSFSGTVGRLLGGVNTNTAKDYASRPFSQLVTTGWSTVTISGFPRNVLTLWGLALNLSSDQTADFPLSLSLGASFPSADLVQGKVGLLSCDSTGAWINSVTLNHGGTPQFVVGPWQVSYTLGTWGIDTVAQTAWAVVNHAGDFAVAPLVQTSTVPSSFSRMPQRGGPMLLRGTILILPSGFTGDGATVELADCSGRVIGCIVTKGNSVDLSKLKNVLASKVVVITATNGRDRIRQTIFLP